MDENPEGYAYIYLTAPFLGKFLFSRIESDSAWIYAYSDRIIIRWRMFGRKSKEIKYSDIVSFSLPDIGECSFGRSLQSMNTEIHFNDEGKTIRISFQPTKNTAWKPWEFPDFIQILRKKIPAQAKNIRSSDK